MEKPMRNSERMVFKVADYQHKRGSVRSVGLLFPETALVFQAHPPVSINIHDNIWCQGEDRQDSTLFEYLRDWAVHAGTHTKAAALSERDPSR